MVQPQHVGQAVSISSQTPDYPLLSAKGNTPSQLKALSSVPAFPGKLVRIAIGLASSAGGEVPTVKLAVRASSSSQQTSFTEYSPVFALSNNAVIADVPFDTVLSGGGTVNVSGKITRADGSESDWLSVQQLRGAQASSIQLKADYYVPSPGSASAKISQSYVTYYTSGLASSGGTGRLFSVTEDWYTPIKSARLSVRHSPLGDSAMTAYAAFRMSPVQVVGEQLGISPSGRKTYQLEHSNGIRYDTFRLYVDSQELSSGFELNCEAGRVTLSAPEGSIISCSYEYGWDSETWRELSLAERVSLADYDMSEFTITDVDGDFSAGAFRLDISGSSGHVSNEALGLSSATARTVRLSHHASALPVVEYYSGGKWLSLSAKNFALMDNSRLLRLAAPAGCQCRCSYDWTSDPVRIWQTAIVFHN